MHLLISEAWKPSNLQIEELKALGYSLCFQPKESSSLVCPYEWVEGVVCCSLFSWHDISEFSNLRYIQLTSAGYETLDLSYIQTHQIEFHTAEDAFAISMAEAALTGVLMVYRKMQLYLCQQRNHLWKKNRDLMELYGKTVCIVGCGHSGNACARRFHAMGCQVIGITHNKSHDMPSCFAYTAEVSSILKILPAADIVVLTLPLNDESRRMWNETMFENMKEGSVLVNISRGAIVQTQALLSALQKKLLGAVLDVVEEEPLSESSPLWKLENVILTPHVSYCSENSVSRLHAVIFKNLRKAASSF